jgi:glutaredoxin 3
MITVYSKNNCPYCVQAKNLLQLKGIVFEEVKIDDFQFWTLSQNFLLNIY